MIQRLLYIVSLVIIFFNLSTHSLSAQIITFEKIIGDTNYTENATSVVCPDENSLIIAGISLNIYSQESKAIITKLDKHGNSVWTLEFECITNKSYGRNKVLLSNDNHLIFMYTSRESRIALAKITTDGLQIWQKEIAGAFNYIGHDMILTKDNGLVIVGNQKIAASDILVIRTDPEGEIQCLKVLDAGKNEYGYTVKQTLDNCFVILGSYETSLTKRRIFLTKLDSLGNTLWQRKFDIASYYGKVVFDLQVTNNDYLIISGGKSLYFTNNIGHPIWSKTFDTKIYSIVSLNDSAFFIATSEDVYQKPNEIIKLDFYGVVLTRKTFSGVTEEIKVSLDSGLIFTGNYKGDYWILKSNKDLFYKKLFLLQPKVSEKIWGGFNYLIMWNSLNIDFYNIEYSTDNGLTWISIIENYSSTSNSFTWKVPSITTKLCKIKIRDATGLGPVTIIETPIEIISPNNNEDYIAINNVLMWFDNTGVGSHSSSANRAGFLWPGGINSINQLSFKDGFLWSFYATYPSLTAGGSSYRSGLQPGQILPGKVPSNPNDSRFKIWKIKKNWESLPPSLEKDRLQYDYINWPIDLGAPWEDINLNGFYDPGIDKPKFYGDETNWFIMNDLDTTKTIALFGSKPIGLEIHSYIFGYKKENFLNDVIFKKYKIINKSSKNLENFIFSYWADPDIGNRFDDYCGGDISLNLAYCYNTSNYDSIWGESPPVIGYSILQGPKQTATIIDSAFFNDKWIKGYKNLRARAFIINTPPEQGRLMIYIEPHKGSHAGTPYALRNYQQGAGYQGEYIYDPITFVGTRFWLTGDPVSGIGWYEGPGWPSTLYTTPRPDDGNRRMLISTHPFTFAVNDTQEVVIVIMAARGSSNLQGIEMLKNNFRQLNLQSYSGLLTSVGETTTSRNYSFVLHQNFPNPFNSRTMIRYVIPTLETQNAMTLPKVTLKIYDVLGREIKTLVNEPKPLGEYEIELNASGFASGVYFYKLEAGKYSATKKLILLR